MIELGPHQAYFVLINQDPSIMIMYIDWLEPINIFKLCLINYLNLIASN